MTKKKNQVTPEEYSEFIEGLNLIQIRLKSSKIDTYADSFDIGEVDLEITRENSYESIDGGAAFKAFQTLELGITNKKDKEEVIGTLEAVFCLDFTTDIPINSDYFQIFASHNLTFNLWPYWREFVQSSMSRASWPQLTVPLLKNIVMKDKDAD